MSIFAGNPLERGWDKSQYLSFILYVIFLCISVWATGESIYRSIGLHKYFSYSLGLVALLGASFCLGLIKRFFSGEREDNRGLLVVCGFVGFVLFWLITFTSNTHNFYYMMTIDEQRKKDYNEVIKQLELGKINPINVFDNAEERYKEKIDAEIINMKREILNNGDPGSGAKTDSIIARIEGVMGNVTINKLKPINNSKRELIRHADIMAEQIREIEMSRIDDYRKSVKQKIIDYVGNPLYKSKLDELTQCVNNINDLDENTLNYSLSKGYSAYSKYYGFLEQLFKNPFLKDWHDFGIKKLDDVPLRCRAKIT